MKSKIILTIVILILFSACISLADILTKKNREITRLSDNQETLMSRLEYHALNESVIYAQASVLSLTIDELSQDKELLNSELKALKTKEKELKEIIKAESIVKIDTIIQFMPAYIDEDRKSVV